MSQGSSPRHFEEEDMGDLIQRTEPETTEQVHWTQHQPLTCDPTTWLNSETLLPWLTIENLSKWTLYKEKGPVQSHKSKKSLLERWEAEDVTEDILQKDMAQKQVRNIEKSLTRLFSLLALVCPCFKRLLF